MRFGWGRLSVDDVIVVVDASGVHHLAVVAEVPQKHRSGDSTAVTMKGGFPKAWVSFDGNEPRPWPCEDIYWPGDEPKLLLPV
jgi:hypothetical protein